ncbi:MAG: alpha/beta hydrolase family protein [Bacteroidales bacterium]|jgi:fermentation-respiration switch protein FrsA (DUF1100 family)
MRKNIFLILIASLLIFASSFAQDITGKWNGILEIPGMQLRIIFNIEQNDDDYSAKLDSPDQGVEGIPCDETLFRENELTIKINSIGAEYKGVFKNDTIKGVFNQMGVEIPLKLTRNEVIKAEIKRPQEPTPPFPYYSEDVVFTNNRDNVTLAGTLTLPSKNGKYPVAVMISGSGPQNRDEELLGHKPFLVIADYLTRNGIGVLRFDDRGTAESSGDFNSATTEDLSYDVEAAVNYLLTRNDINKNKIGLIGHSEGGIIAPMVAVRNKNVSYIVLMAGTGVPGYELILMQSYAINKASGYSDEELAKKEEINRKAIELIIHNKNADSLETILDDYFEKVFSEDTSLTADQKEVQKNMIISQLTSPWMRYFINHDPSTVLEKVDIPVLAINGSKDLQVPAKENLSAIKSALNKRRNKNFKIVEIKGLNHLFQESETGLPAEYAIIEQTISPKALKVMLDWIKKR